MGNFRHLRWPPQRHHPLPPVGKISKVFNFDSSPKLLIIPWLWNPAHACYCKKTRKLTSIEFGDKLKILLNKKQEALDKNVKHLLTKLRLLKRTNAADIINICNTFSNIFNNISCIWTFYLKFLKCTGWLSILGFDHGLYKHTHYTILNLVIWLYSLA